MRSATLCCIMAPRKKSQQPNVGAWLGGNRGYLQSGSNTDTSAKADAGGGQMESVRGELGLGAYAAGIGATAAIGAGIAAAKSGVGKRVLHKTLKRDEVFFFHGSPARGLSEIKPQLPPEATKIRGSSKGVFEGQEIDPLTWGTMISHPSPTGLPKPVWKQPESTLISRAEKAYEYTGPKMSRNRTGSLYVAKVGRKTVDDYGEEMITSATAKVVREINVAGKTREQVYQEAMKELRGLGMKVQKSRGGGKNKK